MSNNVVSFWEHFSRIADFKGREDRASFWPYATFVFVLSMVGCFIVMLPSMYGSMRRMQEFAADHPDQVTVVSGPGHYSMTVHSDHPELMPDFGAMMTGMAIVLVLTILLYAAAIVRRLHDRGKSGLWGLMPLPFLAYSLVQMPRMFGSAKEGQPPDLDIFFSMFISTCFTSLRCLH